tara:strand:+ start:490 stop:1011 length:522 start_codon:yes stop_codon:yes gene_type:complete
MSELRTNRIVPRDGLPAGSSGGIIQVKQGSLTSKFNTSSATMVDCGLSVTITPTRSDSKVLVQVSLGSLANNQALKRAFMNIVRGSTNVITGDAATGDEVTAALCTRSADSDHAQVPVSFMALDSPATTSAITYKVQLSRGGDSGTVYLNGSAGADAYAGNAASTIIVMEVSG